MQYFVYLFVIVHIDFLISYIIVEILHKYCGMLLHFYSFLI